MSLASGARLGPYEVVAAIGAGGMGEVYRATDINLKRSVAIKVLPALMADDPDREEGLAVNRDEFHFQASFAVL